MTIFISKIQWYFITFLNFKIFKIKLWLDKMIWFNYDIYYDMCKVIKVSLSEHKTFCCKRASWVNIMNEWIN